MNITRLFQLTQGGENDPTRIRAELDYNRGGNRGRGYYMTIIPEQVTARDGYLIASISNIWGCYVYNALPVDRASKKAQERAQRIFDANARKLAAAIAAKTGQTIIE